jgi:glycosyltransferase involved in cell wall biosynthesis
VLTAIVPVSGMADRLDHLEKWLPTILNLDIQIIIVHDYKEGETENQLLAIVKAINSSKIEFLSGIYGSPGAARNAGLARVESEYVCFWDSDDLPHPQAVLSELEIHSGEFDILIGQYSWSFVNSNDVGHKKADDSSLRDVGFNPGLWRMVFRMNFIMPVKFKNMRMGEDQLFLAEVVALKPRLSFTNTVLYKYFMGHPNQLTQSPTAIAELLETFTEIVALRKKTSRIEFEFFSILVSRMRFTIAKFAVRNSAKKLMLITIMSPNSVITRYPILQIKATFFVIWRLARSVKHA